MYDKTYLLSLLVIPSKKYPSIRLFKEYNPLNLSFEDFVNSTKLPLSGDNLIIAMHKLVDKCLKRRRE